MFGRGFGWFRALEGSDFLEKLFFLGNEVRDLFALLRVKGLVGFVVGGFGIGAEEFFGVDVEAVDGDVGSCEGEGLVDVLWCVSFEFLTKEV